MLNNYIKTTFRHLLKSKVNFVSKVAGLTLALFSSMVIAVYVFFQLSFDRYHEDYENIYRVNTERKENGIVEKYGVAPLALGDMLKEGFPEISAYSRMSVSNASHIRYEDKIVRCGVFPADSTLFEVLSFRFIRGSEDALKKPKAIVITESIARKLFGDADPMHKLITLNNEKDLFEITAVVEDMPANSHFNVDAFIQLQGDHHFSISNIISPVDFVDQSSVLFVKFEKSAKAELFTTKLDALLDQYVSKKEREENGFSVFLQPLKKVYLDDTFKYDFSRKGSVVYLSIFIVLGVFLLLSALIGYINLSIADFRNRSRELGVRKVLGAGKLQIASQIALETIGFCLCSLVLSVTALYLFFPRIAELLEPALQLSMLLESKIIFFVILIFILLISCSAGFPIYWFTRSNTVNDLKRIIGLTHHSSFGKSLLTLQFIISTICICVTLIISRQLDYIHGKDLGFDRKNLVVLTMPEDFSVQEMKGLKQKLKSLSGVAGVSNSSFRIGGGYWKDWYTIEVNGEMKSLELYEVFSDDELFNTLGMRLLDGRLFNASLPADSGAAFVINETAAREIGWEDPIGKRIFTHPEEEGKWDGTVVGVVEDINIGSLYEKVRPLVMRLPWQNDYPEYFVYIRLEGKINQTLNDIENTFKEIRPGYPLEYHFVDEFYNNSYQKENKAYSTLQIGTSVILLISSLGIFSLAVYMTNRRMKEFGIRKVLGASSQQITFLHIGYFIKIFLIANIIGLPIAHWLMKGWLNSFAYRTELSGVIFIPVIIISLLLVIFSAGHSSWKAGRMNPVDVIKSE